MPVSFEPAAYGDNTFEFVDLSTCGVSVGNLATGPVECKQCVDSPVAVPDKYKQRVDSQATGQAMCKQSSMAGRCKGYTEEANVRPLVHVTGTGKVEKNTGLHEMLESCEVHHNIVHDMDSVLRQPLSSGKLSPVKYNKLLMFRDTLKRI